MPGQAARIAAKAREKRINLRVFDADHLGISLDETTRRSELERVWTCFATNAAEKVTIDGLDKEVSERDPGSPAAHQRLSHASDLRALSR